MKKGFTLIELLIVIAILAVLAGIVIVALNPAELLKQARDGKRMGDLDNLVTALNLYLVDVSSPDLCIGTACSAGADCGCADISTHSGICTATTTVTSVKIFNNSAGAQSPCGWTSTSTTVNGTGWVDVNFGSISGGSPLAVLPLDPTNSDPYLYAYKATTSPNLYFELNTRLESEKHRGKMENDGGNRNSCTTYLEETCWYEKGSKPGLDL